MSEKTIYDEAKECKDMEDMADLASKYAIAECDRRGIQHTITDHESESNNWTDKGGDVFVGYMNIIEEVTGL